MKEVRQGLEEFQLFIRSSAVPAGENKDLVSITVLPTGLQLTAQMETAQQSSPLSTTAKREDPLRTLRPNGCSEK